MTYAPDGTVKRNPTRTVRDESIAALYEQMGERIVCADGGLRAADPSDHDAQATALYLQGQLHGADVTVAYPTRPARVVEGKALSDLYKPVCPACGESVEPGADVVIETLRAPEQYLWDLDNIVNEIGSVLEAMREYTFDLPPSAVLLTAFDNWLGVTDAPAALVAAAKHLPKCERGGR